MMYKAIPNPPAIPKLKQLTNPATGKRMYVTPEGKRYPSVTTILQEYGKEALDAWRKRVGAKRAGYIAATAAGRGSRLHKLCELHLQNRDALKESNVSIFDKELFKSFVPILSDIDNIHVQETRLFSNHLRLAGTVDCIAEYKGKLAIIDFKTSSRHKQKEYIENYFMQCSAYAVMYEELTGIPVPRIVLLIACEDYEPQIFLEKRDNYINHLIQYRDLYEKNNPSYLDDVLSGYICTTDDT